MKAARWHGIEDIRIEAIANPLFPDEDWVQINVKACGICGSDIHEYENGPIALGKKNGQRQQLPPVTLGHEFSGIINEVGKNVSNLTKGMKVVIDAGIPCCECHYCKSNLNILCNDRGILGLTLDGGFAEYINVPSKNCYPVEEEIDFGLLALAEPVTVALHALNRSEFKKDDEVLIIGGGPIGLMILIALTKKGIQRVGLVEPIEVRRSLALELGAQYVIDPINEDQQQIVLENTSDLGADIVFECVGSERTFQSALSLTRKRGKFVVVGSSPENIPINFFDLLANEKEIIGTYGRLDEWQEAINLLIKEEVSFRKLISHNFELNQAQEVFHNIINDKASYIKVILENR